MKPPATLPIAAWEQRQNLDFSLMLKPNAKQPHCTRVRGRGRPMIQPEFPDGILSRGNGHNATTAFI